MTDAGWTALATMVTACCSALAAIYGRQAREQGRTNEKRILQHEEASAARAAAGPAVCRPVDQ